MDPISFKRHKFPPELIRYAVWLYFRFTLSFRHFEDLLAQRGIEVSYETPRCWTRKLGPAIAANLRRRRTPPSGDGGEDPRSADVALARRAATAVALERMDLRSIGARQAVHAAVVCLKLLISLGMLEAVGAHRLVNQRHLRVANGVVT